MGLFNKNTQETLKVEGMKCEHCSARVKDALKSHKVKATISLENKEVVVNFDEKKISLNQIKEIIEKVGFKVI